VSNNSYFEDWSSIDLIKSFFELNSFDSAKEMAESINASQTSIERWKKQIEQTQEGKDILVHNATREKIIDRIKPQIIQIEADHGIQIRGFKDIPKTEVDSDQVEQLTATPIKEPETSTSHDSIVISSEIISRLVTKTTTISRERDDIIIEQTISLPNGGEHIQRIALTQKESSKLKNFLR
jgi:hypothetical protein